MSSFVPIYAVDFDGTLCESEWPGIGAPNKKLIQHLIQRRTEGAKVILWTCRVEEHLKEAVDWCRKDKVIPRREWIENIVEQCRKYNIPVFMKPSLTDIWGEELIQEFPKALIHA